MTIEVRIELSGREDDELTTMCSLVAAYSWASDALETLEGYCEDEGGGCLDYEAVDSLKRARDAMREFRDSEYRCLHDFLNERAFRTEVE